MSIFFEGGQDLFGQFRWKLVLDSFMHFRHVVLGKLILNRFVELGVDVLWFGVLSLLVYDVINTTLPFLTLEAVWSLTSSSIGTICTVGGGLWSRSKLSLVLSMVSLRYSGLKNSVSSLVTRSCEENSLVSTLRRNSRFLSSLRCM